MKGYEGFTFIEALIVIAISAILIIALSGAVGTSFKIARQNFEQFRTTEDARLNIQKASDAIKNVRSIDCNQDGTIDDSELWLQPNADGGSRNNELTIYSRVNNDSNLEKVNFKYDATSAKLSWTIDTLNADCSTASAGQPTVLAASVRNVESSPVFQYFDNSDASATALTNVDSPTFNPRIVKLVGINLSVDVNVQQAPSAAIVNTKVAVRDLGITSTAVPAGPTPTATPTATPTPTDSPLPDNSWPTLPPCSQPNVNEVYDVGFYPLYQAGTITGTYTADDTACGGTVMTWTLDSTAAGGSWGGTWLNGNLYAPVGTVVFSNSVNSDTITIRHDGLPDDGRGIVDENGQMATWIQFTTITDSIRHVAFVSQASSNVTLAQADTMCQSEGTSLKSGLLTTLGLSSSNFYAVFSYNNNIYNNRVVVTGPVANARGEIIAKDSIEFWDNTLNWPVWSDLCAYIPLPSGCSSGQSLYPSSSLVKEYRGGMLDAGGSQVTINNDVAFASDGAGHCIIGQVGVNYWQSALLGVGTTSSACSGPVRVLCISLPVTPPVPPATPSQCTWDYDSFCASVDCTYKGTYQYKKCVGNTGTGACKCCQTQNSIGFDCVNP